MIIFLHIQKTSGTSINRILRHQNQNFWYKYSGQKNPDIVSGHVPFGIHRQFQVKRFSYFTFLRHPIKRWKSQLNHALRNPRSIGHMLFEECKFDIDIFLDYCAEHDINKNTIIRQISGIENKTNTNTYPINRYPTKDFGYNGMYGWFGRKKKSNTDHYEYMLELSTKNICKIDFVGFQKNAQQDYNRLCDFYGFKNPGIVYLRRSRSNNISWTASAENKLLELNRFDIQFYDYVVNAFRKSGRDGLS